MAKSLNNSDSSKLLAKLMSSSLSKNPALAAKQRRLLDVLSGATKSGSPSDSMPSESGTGPTPPKRPPQA